MNDDMRTNIIYENSSCTEIEWKTQMRPNPPGKVTNSPVFSTYIKNLECEWQFALYPGGIREEYKDYVSIYVKSLTLNNFQATVSFSYTINGKVYDCKRKSAPSINKCENILGCDACGTPQFISRRIFYNTTVYDYEDDYDSAVFVRELKSVMILCKIVIPNEQRIVTLDATKGYLKNIDLNGFEKLLDDQKHYDVIFKIDDKVIKAHKCILAHKNAVFAAMFEHDTVEKKKNLVAITDVTYDVFKKMLKFLYAGKLNDIKEDAADLLIVANKYLLEELKTACEESLCKNVNIENVIEYVRLADAYNANVLKNKTIQFIVSNSDKIMDKPELLSLTRSHPEIMCSIFRAMSNSKKT